MSTLSAWASKYPRKRIRRTRVASVSRAVEAVTAAEADVEAEEGADAEVDEAAGGVDAASGWNTVNRCVSNVGGSTGPMKYCGAYALDEDGFMPPPPPLN